MTPEYHTAIFKANIMYCIAVIFKSRASYHRYNYLLLITISNNISISSLVDISSGGYVVNYTKNKLNEIGTHQETKDRYHELFDDPNWEGYEEGRSTEWGKGVFSRFLNEN